MATDNNNTVQDYSTVDFNDPFVCKSVNTKKLGNYDVLEDFLVELQRKLSEGMAKPNLACFETLSALADSSNPDDSFPMVETFAQNILHNHYYEFVPLLSKKESKEGKQRIPTEYTEHLPSDLAKLLTDYYSTCALLNMDGQKCGLGQDGGFQYSLPPISTPDEWSNCARECTSDLCPRWLESLFTRIPKMVTVTQLETGKSGNILVKDVVFSTSGGVWYHRLSND